MSPVIPPEIIARIKDETDIVELIRGYVTLRPAGASYKGLCPFHAEKTPSFHVNPARQFYKCFGCGAGGDAIAFLMTVESLSFPEALETLARSLDIDLSRYLQDDDDEGDGERRAFLRAHETAAAIYRETLWDEREGRDARAYLVDRGFEPEILAAFDVGWAPPSTRWQQRRLAEAGVNRELALRSGLLRQKNESEPFAYFRSRIIFPVTNIAKQVTGFGGRIVGQGEPKYLNSPDSAYYSKGKLLYGFAASRLPIARSRTAILVEGYLDLLALAQAGINNAVATCGTAFTADQARLIRRGATSVVMLFDGDRAGLHAAVKSCQVALAAGLDPTVARLPAGEDPASLMQRGECGELRRVLAEAQPYLKLLVALVQERGAGRRGRERALRQALVSIGGVADPIRKEYLLQEAAELFEIRPNLLREELARQEADERRGSRRRAAATAAGEIGADAPARGADVGPAAAATATAADPDAGSRPSRLRSFRRVDVEEIERVLFAHVLRDGSGLAARTFLAERGDLPLSGEAAERLAAELAAWHGQEGDQDRTPADFVQRSWYGDGDEDYRSYVTDVIAKEGVPDQTDFVRAVRDSLARLRLGRGARPH
ncbi:MAG: DNA primase [Candidatus Krumholzibacteriia bacterium]